MKSKPAILTIDEGTSGTRAALVSDNGCVYALEYESLRVISPQAHVVEQDANMLLEKTLTVCRRCLLKARDNALHVVALALSVQRCTAVLWDADSGKALVPAMVWQDCRYSSQLQHMAGNWDARLLAETGRPAGIRSPFLWAVWHLQHTPEVQQAFAMNCLRFGTVDSWLLWHLSDETSVVTTPTNATSTGAYCLLSHSYYQPWLDALQFPSSLLPQLREDAGYFGYSRKDLIGISVPVYACIGDQYAGAIGLGCIQPGQAMCIHGTGSFVDLFVGEKLPLFSQQCESTLTMVARRVCQQSHFAVETFVPATGSALNWLCETLNWFDDARQISALADVAHSSGGIIFIPALTGLRVPRLEPNVRAMLSGITLSTTRNELAYAILQGIAHAVTDCLYANTSTTGIQPVHLVAGGGLSASDPLLQIQANLSGIPVIRMEETASASLRGAAFLAGSQGLFWDSLESACATLRVARCFEPALDARQREQRQQYWQSRIEHERCFAQSHLNGGC